MNYGKTLGIPNKGKEHDFMEKEEVGRDSKAHLRKARVQGDDFLID